MFVKIAMILIFIAVTVGVGIACRKKAANVGDFVLGGRAVGPWLTAFAYGTSYFSAVVFVGYAGQFGWNFGVSAAWIGIGNALIGSMLAWIVLGRRTRIMTKHLHSSTMPNFFESRYDSSSLKKITSLITFVFLVPYSASVYKGLSGLFSITFNVDFIYCIIIMAVITALYVVIGGYVATAVNDLIQGTIMFVGIICVVWAVLSGQGGFSSAISKLSAIPGEASSTLSSPYTSLFGPDVMGLISVLLLTSLGAWGLPQMVHKFYTIKDEKAIKTGTVVSTVFAFVIAGGSYFMGAFGRLYYTPADGAIVYDDIVPTMLSGTLPDILIGIILILVLSASMSTLSSLVITSSSTFVLDFSGSLFADRLSETKKMIFIRVMCAVFVLASVLIALNPSSLITSLMSLSWGALAGSFLGPFIYGLFWKGTTRLSVWFTILVGLGINISNMFLHFLSPPAAGALAIAASLITVPLISFITPKLPSDKVNSVFECYKK